jgi:hypothetical protein
MKEMVLLENTQEVCDENNPYFKNADCIETIDLMEDCNARDFVSCELDNTHANDTAHRILFGLVFTYIQFVGSRARRRSGHCIFSAFSNHAWNGMACRPVHRLRAQRWKSRWVNSLDYAGCLDWLEFDQSGPSTFSCQGYWVGLNREGLRAIS